MNILIVGDIVGKVGRKAVAYLLPQIKQSHSVNLIIANGENAAAGKGLTPSTAEDLFEAGVDIITSGNHIWQFRDVYPLLDSEAPILRPLNYPRGVPGRGVLTRDDVAVINLQGRTFMPGALDCPFHAVNQTLTDLGDYRLIVVDVHAEATSEKAALAWYLDGRVSAVVGSHTHVATADARLLPGGTAFITDVGMVGPRDSILGMEAGPVIEGFLSQLPTRFNTAEHGPVVFNSVLVEVDDESGRASGIQRIDHEIA